MYNNFILFFLSYFLILTSVLGYGLFLLRIVEKKKEITNFGYVGLIGIFFLIFYSYVSNIFIAHSELHNIIFLIIGLIFFLLTLKKKYLLLKKELIFTFTIFIFLFISSLIFKNHDDFPYYHFPYTYYLTQQSLFIGIGQFNHGFRTPSSIFYLNSLLYLPIVKYYLFNFSSIYILGFANIILLKKTHSFFISLNIKDKFKQNINYINFLSLFLFVFINIFFYRIGEHGTDRSAQILIFLLIVIILEFFYYQKIKKLDLLFIYILLGLIISLKSFYILYLIILLPLFIFVFEKYKNLILTFEYFIKNKFFVLFTILLIFIIGTYFINTGCLIYPISFTCFENFSWALPINEVQRMNNWYELWSKAGANPNFRVVGPDEYILKFNWVGNWIDSYFFNKVSDFILGVIFVIIVFLILFVKKSDYKKKQISKYALFTYFILILLAFEWFYNHPALRYGGYCLISLILFIPTSFYLSSFTRDIKKFTNSVTILILLTSIIFLGRNINRINKEAELYKYMPINKTFFKVDNHYFRIQNQMEKTLNNENKVKKVLGKKTFILIK